MKSSMKDFFVWCKANSLRVICFVFLIALLISSMVFYMWLTDNWNNIANTPVAKNGVIDFVDCGDITEKIMNPYLVGEWEFFYNRWIITDNDTGAPDGLIELPGRWTDKKYNDKRLSKIGYASYRLTVKNMNSSVPIGINMLERQVAFRAYINGVLVTESGEAAKSEADSRVSFAAVYHELYTPVSQSDTIEIVIEIGGISHGGLVAVPTIYMHIANLKNAWMDANFTLSLAPYITIGVLIMALAFCSLLPSQNRRSANLLAVFLGLLLIRFLTGDDGGRCVERLFTVDKAVLVTVRNITSFIIPVVFAFALRESGYCTLKNKQFIIISLTNGAALIAALLLRHTVIQIIPLCIPFLTFLVTAWLVFKSKTAFKFFVPLITITATIILIYHIELFTSQGLVTFGTAGLESICFFIVSVILSVIIILQMKEINKIALEKLQADAVISKIKQQALTAQIKPHFIFNTMAAIQNAYAQSTDFGDEIMSKFAHHLRVNADSNNMEFVPFESELKNILNYFELENMRANGRLNLILDADYTDFSIPPLSLQPFLENAIKYAGTQDIDEGYICISSTLDNKTKEVFIKIIDNGKGFCLKNVRGNAVGIKNATERLVYGVNAKVLVESEVGSGTTVTLIIPQRTHNTIGGKH